MHEVNYVEKVVYEIHEFPELLALRGHDITFFEFTEGLTKSNFPRNRDRVIQGRVYSQAKIRLVSPPQFGIPLIDRLFAIVSCIPAIYALLRLKKFDVILNYAVPTYGLQILILSKIFKIPVIHRALDVSHQIRESIFNPLIKIWEKIIYRYADFLSANNQAMGNYCTSISGRLLPTEVNYPPLDAPYFSEVRYDCALAKKLGISLDDRVITYMGSFFYFSGLEEVIRNFDRASRKRSDLKLLLIGGGEIESQLRALVETLGLQKRVIFTGFVSFSDLPSYLKLSSVAINPLKPSLVSNVAFPHKVLQYMAAGIPTVSTELDGLYSAFGETSGLTWSKPGDDIIDVALNLISNLSESEKVKKKQYEAVTSLFSVKSTVNSLEALIERAAQRRP